MSCHIGLFVLVFDLVCFVLFYFVCPSDATVVIRRREEKSISIVFVCVVFVLYCIMVNY